VVIGKEVKKISSSAFKGCSGLTAVTIPNSVTEIGSAAFEGCNLAAVTIPASVKKIGFWCFANNKSLKSASVPGTIKPGTNEYFRDCPNLKTVTVRTGNGAKRSTAAAWFKDPTPTQPSVASSSSKPKIDPNSMSWPEPDLKNYWSLNIKFVEWSGGFVHETIFRDNIGGKITYFIPGLGRYKNYNEAEAAAYFWTVHKLERTRGLDR
jgi:hypothetical protein